MDSIVIQLLILFVLTVLNGIFSCAEISIVSVNDAKISALSKEGNIKAKRLEDLTKNPSHFFSTIQIGITIAGFLTSAIAANSFSGYLVDFFINIGLPLNKGLISAISLLIITIILAYFNLVFGELVPKRIGMNQSEKIAMNLSGMVYVISKIAAPAVWFLTASTNLVLRIIGIDPNQENEAVTEEEIRMMVNLGREKGTIDDEEQEMIHNVFNFDDLTAQDVMVHRSNMPVLWLDSLDEWKDIFNNASLYALPVCNESLDDIVGILDIKKLSLVNDITIKDIELYVEEPEFIPSYFKLSQVFKNMKYRKVNLAMMVDEYGGVDGIITMDDILSEIVGDYTDEDSDVIEIGEDYLILNGNITLDDLKNDYHILIEDELSTLGAAVVEEIGYLPKDGLHDINIKLGEYVIEILEIKNRKIERMRLLSPHRLDDEDNNKNKETSDED